MTHFSGDIIGRGTKADRAAQAKRQPSRPEDRMKQLEAISDKTLDEAAAIYGHLGHQYYLKTLRPLLGSGAENTELLFQAAQKYISWKKSMEKLNDKDLNNDIQEGYEVLKKAIRTRAEEEAKLCPNWTAFSRLQKLINIASMVGDSEGVQFIVDKWFECGVIKVKFSSRAQSGGGGFSWIYQVSGELELKASVEGETIKFTGRGPLAYNDFHMEGDTGCSPVTKAHGSTMSASAELNANLREGQQPPPSVALRIDPGGPSEDYALDCPYVGRTSAHAGTHAWQEIFMASNPGTLKLDGLDLESGAPVEKAFKGKTVPFGDNQASADATVTIAFT